MLRSEEALLGDLTGSNDDARAAALEELLHSAQPVAGRVRAAVESIRADHPVNELRDRAAGLIAIADAQSRINRVRKTWGATLNPMLLGSILRNPNVAVRRKAIDTIRSRDAKPFGDVVAERLLQESEKPILLGMIALVGRTGNRDLVPFLDPLVDRPDPVIGLAALEAMVKLAGEPRPATLTARLEQLVAGHPSADVRFLARRSLGASRAAAGTAPAPEGPLTPERLAGLLGDGASDARLAAIDAAAVSGDRGLAATVAGALAAERDVRVLARMVSVLKNLGSAEQAEAVRPLLKHADDRVCANAIETLVALAGAVSVESLLPLLARDDNRLKANLVLALRDQYRVQVEGYVRRMLRAERFSFRISALYCARFLDREEIYPDVLRMVSEEENGDALRDGLSWLAEYGAPERAAQDLADLALVRPQAAGPIRDATARLAARDPRAAQAVARAPAEDALSSGAVPLSPGGPPEPPRASDRPFASPQSRVSTPRTRPVRAAPGEGFDLAWLRDWRVAAVLAVVAGLGVLRVLYVSLRGDDDPGPAPAAHGSILPVRPATPTPLKGVITRISGRDGVWDVDVEVRRRTYSLRWPAGAPARPAVGDAVLVGSLRVVKQPDGSVRLTADQLTPAPRP